ncbi:NXPE family member 2-like [Littorina saxatilis]|uniref:NXPE family member 2-like n=1 Tax=Littorina saxatilis TaxID=31220 RepID=UPI0038B42CCF
MVGRKKIVFFVAIVISIALTSFFIFQTQIGPVINRPPSFFAWDPCRLKTGLLTDPHPVFEPNEDFLVPFLRKRGLPAQRGVGVRREGLDPLEGYLFRQPPTTDSRCLPEELNSTVHIINPHDRYIVGDTVQLFVDLYTGYGTRRHWGGDDVRLWLKSAKGNSSMAVKVTDLNNGSYVGYAVLKWPGITLVRVSLAHPQEYLRGLAEMLHTIGNLRWSVDTFNNTQRTKEKTLCSPLAPIPGFAKICNLTSRNGDRSWFCSHPVSEGLNCSHWSKTRNMPPLSDTEWPITSVVRPFIAKLRK